MSCQINIAPDVAQINFLNTENNSALKNSPFLSYKTLGIASLLPVTCEPLTRCGLKCDFPQIKPTQITEIFKIYHIFRFYILKLGQIPVFMKIKAIQDINVIIQRNMSSLISVTVDPNCENTLVYSNGHTKISPKGIFCGF